MASRGQFVVSPDKRVCAVQRHVPKVLLRLAEDELGGSNSGTRCCHSSPKNGYCGKGDQTHSDAIDVSCHTQSSR